MGVVRWEVFQKISADTSATHKSSEVHNKRHYGCCNMRCTQVVTPLSSCWGIIQWCLGKRSHFHSSQANSFQLSLCCFSVGNIERLFFFLASVTDTETGSLLGDRQQCFGLNWASTFSYVHDHIFLFCCHWSQFCHGKTLWNSPSWLGTVYYLNVCALWAMNKPKLEVHLCT